MPPWIVQNQSYALLVSFWTILLVSIMGPKAAALETSYGAATESADDSKYDGLWRCLGYRKRCCSGYL